MNESDITTPSKLFQEVTLDAAATRVDYLIRLTGSCPEDMKYSVTGTDKLKSHFANIFEHFKFVKDTLVEVIFSQKRSLDYNGFYNAFLMRQLSEEEFINIAGKYTYQPKTIDINVLASKVNILFNLTQIDYSASELADIFQCTGSNVNEAIQFIGNNDYLRERQ